MPSLLISLTLNCKMDSVEAAYRDVCASGLLPGVVLLAADKDGTRHSRTEKTHSPPRLLTEISRHFRLQQGHGVPILQARECGQTDGAGHRLGHGIVHQAHDRHLRHPMRRAWPFGPRRGRCADPSGVEGR